MSQFHLILSVLKVIPDSRFISVCNKIISHDRVDIITIEAWCNRIRFEQIFDNIEYQPLCYDAEEGCQKVKHVSDSSRTGMV